jgi:Uri superfamily endonuclease
MPKGTYCIIFKLKNKLTITVKSGKTYTLQKGTYVYVGSAWNSGGIESRVKRHLKRNKRKHWYLDFITTTNHFEAQKVITIPNRKVECNVASLLSTKYGGIEKFGCSDCNCFSHLFKITQKEITKVTNALQNLYNIEIYKPETLREEQVGNKRDT